MFIKCMTQSPDSDFILEGQHLNFLLRYNIQSIVVLYIFNTFYLWSYICLVDKKIKVIKIVRAKLFYRFPDNEFEVCCCCFSFQPCQLWSSYDCAEKMTTIDRCVRLLRQKCYYNLDNFLLNLCPSNWIFSVPHLVRLEGKVDVVNSISVLFVRNIWCNLMQSTVTQVSFFE